MEFKYASGMVPGTENSKQRIKYENRIGFAEKYGTAVLYFADCAAIDGNKGVRPELPGVIAAAFMTEDFDRACEMNNEQIRNAIADNLEEALSKSGGAFSADDSTLLFLAVKGDRYLAGHLGGGLIAAYDERCFVLSHPEEVRPAYLMDSGEATPFLAEMRIYKGAVKKHDGFILLNGGACRSLYDAGIGRLSPACDTFFSWLNEYDSETVSDALKDNILKYFNKDSGEDIGIALMLAQGAATEEAAVANTAAVSNTAAEVGSDAGAETDFRKDSPDAFEKQETVQDESDSPGSIRKYLKFIIVGLILILLASAAYAIAMNRPFDSALPNEQGEPAEKPDSQETEPKEVLPGDNVPENKLTDEDAKEPTITFAVDNPKSFDAGIYQVGTDLPAGEYFFWTGEMLKADSVMINDETCLSGELYCMTIRVAEGDTLTTESRFTEASNVDPVAAANGELISGKYKIGKDLMPGMYLIKPAELNTAGRYYSVFNGELGNDTEITGDTTVTVPEEGYVVFYNAVLMVNQD